VPGLPDENFNKNANSAEESTEKGQTGCLVARKKPNFVLFLYHKLQKYHQKLFSKMRLSSLAGPT